MHVADWCLYFFFLFILGIEEYLRLIDLMIERPVLCTSDADRVSIHVYMHVCMYACMYVCCMYV
jgi:hypothetical protein